MTLRNFYIECEIDGRKRRLTDGPRAKDGGFSLTIYQRSNGKKIEALNIRGYVPDEGKLVLELKRHERFRIVSLDRELIIANR